MSSITTTVTLDCCCGAPQGLKEERTRTSVMGMGVEEGKGALYSRYRVHISALRESLRLNQVNSALQVRIDKHHREVRRLA